MKHSSPRFKNKFFFKMMLTFCLVIFMGLGLASYFVASEMTDIMIEMESRVDYEVVEKVKFYSDDKYKAAQSIFARLYMQLNYNNNTSVVDFLNPRKEAQLDTNAKNAVISSYLQDTCSANAFISDIFIVDYSSQDVFFFSNVAGRDVSIGYDFFQPDFLGKEEINNQIRVIPNHFPSYINAPSVNNYPVISFCIYLFDETFMRFDQPLGFIVINLWADFFKGAYQNSDNFNGTLYVVEKGGMTLFDSSGGNTGQPFPFNAYNADSFSDLASNNDFIVNTQYSEATGFTYVDIVDKQVVRQTVSGVLQSIYSIIGVCIILMLLISLISATIFSNRIQSLVNNMKGIESGRFDTRIAVSSKDEFGYLEHCFNSMCEKLEEYIQNVYVFQLKTKSAELKALQSQINPHFLFNTLESIRISAQINGDTQTAKMIHILGNMFRWNIKMQGMFVDLKEEFDYMNSYFDLQKLRYDNAFALDVVAQPGTPRLGVPKLILQPLVENAINHGLNGREAGGVISVSSTQEKGRLVLVVADNGRGMDAARVQEVLNSLDKEQPEAGQYHIGLSNVHQRIRILFGEDYGVTISSSGNTGTQVRVTMPALGKEEMEQYVQSGDCG